MQLNRHSPTHSAHTSVQQSIARICVQLHFRLQTTRCQIDDRPTEPTYTRHKYAAFRRCVGCMQPQSKLCERTRACTRLRRQHTRQQHWDKQVNLSGNWMRKYLHSTKCAASLLDSQHIHTALSGILMFGWNFSTTMTTTWNCTAAATKAFVLNTPQANDYHKAPSRQSNVNKPAATRSRSTTK